MCAYVFPFSENNTISVWNNGKGIPVVEHKVEKVYVPALIFGQLLTSSNYDDDEKKVTGENYEDICFDYSANTTYWLFVFKWKCFNNLDFISLVLAILAIGHGNIFLTNDIAEIWACDDNAKHNFTIESCSV